MQYAHWIYTLELEDGYYYVGQTINIDRRKNEHLIGKDGAAWTKLHKPLEECVLLRKLQIIEANSDDEADQIFIDLENRQTLNMMRKYGWQKVRGGFWCNTDELQTLKGLQAHNYYLDENEEIKLSSNTIIYVAEKDSHDIYVGFIEETPSLHNLTSRTPADCVWMSRQKYTRILEVIKPDIATYAAVHQIIDQVVICYSATHGFDKVRGGSFIIKDPEALAQNKIAYIKNREKTIKASSSFGSTQEPQMWLVEYEKKFGDISMPNTIKKDNEVLYYLFAMELVDQYYYISCSKNIHKYLRSLARIHKKSRAEWYKLHEPISIDYITTIYGDPLKPPLFALDPIMAEYFNRFGPERVRGGHLVISDDLLHLRSVHEHYKVVDGKYILTKPFR